MVNGLILLVFIGALLAFAWARTRRRLGMNVTGRTYLSVIVGVVIVGLALWAFSTRR